VQTNPNAEKIFFSKKKKILVNQSVADWPVSKT
jgi:hypothetical protein